MAGSRLMPRIDALEVAFSTPPFSTSPVWNEITDYIALEQGQLTVQRGRADERSLVDPSVLSYPLNNSDGRFTPNRAASPYYPNVKTRRRKRYWYTYTPKNLVPNPTFEVDLAGWTAGGSVPPALSRSSTHAHSGTWAMLITWGTGGTFPQAAITLTGLIPGRTYTASAWVYVPSGGSPACKLAIATLSAGSPSTLTNQFQQIIYTFTATATSHSLQVWPDTSPTSGQQVWVDDVQVEPGTSATAFSPTGAQIYWRFDGHADGWPLAYVVTGGTPYAPVQVSATDRLKWFAQTNELRSVLEQEVLRDTDALYPLAAAYFPLSESDGSVSFTSIAKQREGIGVIRQVDVGGTIGFGQGTGPGTDEISAPLFQPVSATAGKYLDVALSDNLNGTGVTLEIWFRADSGILSRMLAVLESSYGHQLSLTVGSDGKLHAQRYSGITLLALSSSTVVNNNQTHHAVITESISGSVVTSRLYLDGTQVDTAFYSWTNVDAYTFLHIGGVKTGQLFSGTLSHVAAYETALASSRIAEHYNAGNNGIAGERTDQRIARIADWIGIPTADRALDVGASTVGWQGTSGQQPREAMDEAMITEAGVLFESGDNKLTFHGRNRRYNKTPDVTLDAQQAAQVGIDIVFPGDDLGLENDVTVDRQRAAPMRAVNQASIDDLGLYRNTITTIHDTDDQAQSLAEWRVNNYGTFLNRVPNIKVNCYVLDTQNPLLLMSILTLEISSKIHIINLPAQAPISTLDLFVEGSLETVGVGEWSIVFNCSPADFYNVWQLGVAGYSEIGITTKLAH
jgi:Concanavalin A-like lectin/glucanases superfamily/Carbohydrate binding domain